MRKTCHKQLLRKHQVADRLRVSRATVDVWTRAGKIPAIYHPLGKGRGRIVRYDWAQVCKALGISEQFGAGH